MPARGVPGAVRGQAMTAMETDGGGEDGSPQKRLSGKKVILFVVLPLFALIAGGAGIYYSGIFSKKEHAEEGEHAAAAEEEKVDPHAPPAFVDLPEILVNLQTGERRPSFLKLAITLELMKAEDQAELNRVMPRITDTFQTYLRELRADDLKGSAGIYRLREELLMRINTAAHPLRIRDVLIKEFLVQ
jgi:flagellar FliL protein